MTVEVHLGAARLYYDTEERGSVSLGGLGSVRLVCDLAELRNAVQALSVIDNSEGPF